MSKLKFKLPTNILKQLYFAFFILIWCIWFNRMECHI